ncbi:MAG: hypothetical protein RMK97_10960 [Sutterellaceae bacterium]|nr:hypothetical protein [Burkholderiaceae bacterium]MCX7901415.1 hypothetical protein [Burkholderiaceae bacterium]MDW8430999.1 hypothetical protein [Sutterellaceae bacterium]
MKKTLQGVAFSAALLGASAAAAQALALRAGLTTGFGAELGYGVNDYLAVRASYGAGSLSYDTTESDIRYDFKWKPQLALLTADIHPFAGWFRVSVGFGNHGTKLTGRAVATSGTLEIGNQTFNAADVGSVDARVSFKRASPYLGIGWGAAARGNAGFYFTSDIGVVFSRATGSVTGTCAAGVPPATCTQLQQELQNESQSFRQEVERIKYYPVITVGVGYRF